MQSPQCRYRAELQSHASLHKTGQTRQSTSPQRALHFGHASKHGETTDADAPASPAAFHVSFIVIDHHSCTPPHKGLQL